MSTDLMCVVVAYSPVIDTTAVVGLFPSHEWAMEASQHLVSIGYNTEICALSKVEDVPPSAAPVGSC